MFLLSLIGSFGAGLSWRIGQFALNHMLNQTGLYIGRSMVSNFIDTGQKWIQGTFYESINSILLSVVAASTGKSIFDMLSKEKVKTEKKNSFDNHSLYIYLVLGIATYMLHQVGVRDIKEFLNQQKRRDIEDVLRQSQEIDSLGIFAGSEHSYATHEKQWSLYTAIVNRFYKGNSSYDPNAAATNAYNISFIRAIFNVILGLSIKIDSLIKNPDENNGENSSQWISLLLYIEMLAHLLRMHNVAPMYASFKYIVKMLFPNYYSKVYITANDQRRNPWAK